MALEITTNNPKPTRLLEDIRSYALSHNGKKLLLHKGDAVCSRCRNQGAY